MNTFLDYIEWRGDIEFSYDGFNEVDNMLLSTLAYSDYENVIDADSAPLDLDTVRKRYFHFHTREVVGQRKPRSLTAPLLMDDLIQSKRFQDLKIGYYVNHVSEDSVTQFSAMTMDFNDFVYIAFRGTDNSLTGWKEDLLLSFKSGIHAQVFAVDYLNRYMKDETRDIIVGGHSKGGNLAVYAAAFCEASIRDKIKIIYSNDGPGFLKEITESENYLSIKDRIYSIIPESSIVGLLLNNDIEHHVIKSYSTGMHQHDPYSWLVYRNSFVREERISKSNAFLDKTLDDWLNNLSEEEKETFV
ncbi:MAG: DUF2974 domain-containing protein, partial [Solobacterium sp.]|nr:DUF2974 domain-containing protein [Solobacterium sp.]